MLADFRQWLLAAPPNDDGRTETDDGRPPVDLFALIGQFTALRHEVNLQTKAARAAVEQNAEVLRQLADRDEEPEPEPADDDEVLRPAVKAVIDVADALALSHRQAEKLRDGAAAILKADAAHAARPGFFARLFGAAPAAPPPDLDALRKLAAGVADGYALSIRRVERLLPTWEVEAVRCTNEEFDPEMMEVVEVVADSGLPAGTVVEEVRPGYRWRGRLVRFAQVKVAR
ncbi:nucleotide exchange factor GrpE [Urbifossiella limnaea]|uniref:nucleotide exchange factor GrpE n=1 Tax=Urbifossiella limnaea TaxID=2528023 RepID=UPI00192E4B89|nr:nucleotide exchange factor GrpE [Urbifossiella limnaea]